MDLTRLMLACGKAFIISFVLTPIARDVFRAYNVVDRPGLRKVHAYPIPRVGGVPIALAYFFGLLSLRGPGSVFPLHWLQTILSGALVILLTGLIDDFFDLKPAVKLLGQIAAGATAFANGLSIDHMGNFDLPVLGESPSHDLLAVADNQRAESHRWPRRALRGHRVVGNLHVLCRRVHQRSLHPGLHSAAAGGRAAGFLFLISIRLRFFLGDSGALLVGFLLGCFGIVWGGHRITPTSVAIASSGFVRTDGGSLGLSIVCRRLKRRPVFFG